MAKRTSKDLKDTGIAKRKSKDKKQEHRKTKRTSKDKRPETCKINSSLSSDDAENELVSTKNELVSTRNELVSTKNELAKAQEERRSIILAFAELANAKKKERRQLRGGQHWLQQLGNIGTSQAQ